MESNINRRLVRAMIPDVISRSPTKHHCALAKQAMEAASDEESGNILLELIKFTRDSVVVGLAKQRVHEYPNAPESFTINVRSLNRILRRQSHGSKSGLGPRCQIKSVLA